MLTLALSFSFTQGFLLGQLSVVLLIGAFIKFFIFGEPPLPSNNSGRTSGRSRKDHFPQHHRSISLSSASSPSRLKAKGSATQHILRPTPRCTTASILSKTYYNVDAHPPESLDWFNVLIAQTIAQFRRDAQDEENGGGEALLSSLTGLLNAPGRKPEYVGEIRVTEISLGEEFPLLSNCRIGPVYEHDESPPIAGTGTAFRPRATSTSEKSTETTGPRLQARMDVDLSDFLTLGIETTIHLNYPYPLTATLPISLAVSIVRFSGTLSISFLPSSSPHLSSSSHSPQPQSLAFSLLPDYRLDIHTTSQIGSRSRLQDMPKIGQLVDAQLRTWIAERCVEPRVQQVVLPSLWPRKGNVRMGSGAPHTAAAAAAAAGAAGLTFGKEDGASGSRPSTAVTGSGSGGDEPPYHLHPSQYQQAPLPGPTSAPAQGFPENGDERERQHAHGLFEEGLRARRREYDMPGGMPGTLVS